MPELDRSEISSQPVSRGMSIHSHGRSSGLPTKGSFDRHAQDRILKRNHRFSFSAPELGFSMDEVA